MGIGLALVWSFLVVPLIPFGIRIFTLSSCISEVCDLITFTLYRLITDSTFILSSLAILCVFMIIKGCINFSQFSQFYIRFLERSITWVKFHSLKKKVSLINGIETAKMESSSSWTKCILHSQMALSIQRQEQIIHITAQMNYTSDQGDTERTHFSSCRQGKHPHTTLMLGRHLPSTLIRKTLYFYRAFCPL